MKITTKEQFAQVVFDQYMSVGRVATFQELAAHAGCSVSSLRKIFSAAKTCVPGVEVAHEDRPVVCQTSGGALRHRKVKVLCPARWYMRRKYLELQKRVKANAKYDESTAKA